MVEDRLAGAILTIDLDALAANWRALAARVRPTTCAAVVKADAYGIGVERAVLALAGAGCQIFFVAHAAEGITVRAALPSAEIYVLNGAPRGAESDLRQHRLMPVLNGLADVDAWRALAGADGELPAAIQIDTGMTRLGLSEADVAALAAEPERLAGIDIRCCMSHLACADEPDHPLNRAQLEHFNRLRAQLPAAPTSLANSSGIFLGREYHFDLVRPGVALYGGNPTPGKPNPMAEVVRLQGRILQVHDVDSPMTVGYGATHKIGGSGRIATVPVGYADGYLRVLGDNAYGYIGDTPVPVVGRVSMDLITLDVSQLAPDCCRPGTLVDLIGGAAKIDAVAASGGTISYELLTSLGNRYHRAYRGGA